MAQSISKREQNDSIQEQNLLLQNLMPSTEDDKLPKEKQQPSSNVPKSGGPRASHLTQHVIGAILNLFAALSGAGQVTALQLVSVNITYGTP